MSPPPGTLDRNANIVKQPSIVRPKQKIIVSFNFSPETGERGSFLKKSCSFFFR
jgi:hypothetical protein